MARVNRREVLAESEIQVVHCVNRCVRRGFLCRTATAIIWPRVRVDSISCWNKLTLPKRGSTFCLLGV